MAETSMLRVQVCYALQDSAFVTELSLSDGTTLRQAVEASGLLQQHPDINLESQKAGIFGKVKPADTVLRDGDRVEVYRSLQADPKETRRRRAKHKDKLTSDSR